ncbi:MAG: L-rhamnose/proton symporter RhaT, partial [Kiritimatiellae bacterium]|nr:L-rhamnose/proton symporter RhaT [Kiritimatiellia bacterium]
GMGPFLIHNRDQLFTAHGFVIMAGVAVCIVGVVVCGRAAMLKSKSQESVETGPSGGKMIKGLAFAFLSGVLCACYSIAFSYGGGVMEVSMKSFGNPGWRAAFAVSALILWGGSVSALGYCIFKFFKNKSWNTLSSDGIGHTLLIALVMALLHNGAIIFFGIGASKLGALGVAIGYAVFMSFAIIVGNINGFLTHEWKGASSGSVRWIVAGICVLVLGVSILATGNYMQGEYQKKAVTNVKVEK